MDKVKVGVVRGGPSFQYDISLKTGGEVLKHLPKNYEGVDVLLTKDDQWHLNGFLKKPDQVFNSVDVVFNALHGEYGEDGKAQMLFESFNTRFTGSESIASSLAMNKHLGRNSFFDIGIKIPKTIVLESDDLFGIDAESAAKDIFNAMSPPWVVKPASSGSSLGVSICKNFYELSYCIDKASKYSKAVLVEEYIKGREATCGVLEDFRGEKHYALPVIEIIPPDKEICPAGFDHETKRKIEDIAKRAHAILGCRHYSRADFIVSPRGIYLLEINTLPVLTSESLYPKAAAAAGLEFPQLLDHLLQLALNRK